MTENTGNIGFEEDRDELFEKAILLDRPFLKAWKGCKEFNLFNEV